MGNFWAREGRGKGEGRRVGPACTDRGTEGIQWERGWEEEGRDWTEGRRRSRRSRASRGVERDGRNSIRLKVNISRFFWVPMNRPPTRPEREGARGPRREESGTSYWAAARRGVGHRSRSVGHRSVSSSGRGRSPSDNLGWRSRQRGIVRCEEGRRRAGRIDSNGWMDWRNSKLALLVPLGSPPS